jgi:hypothetical protein
MQSICPDRIQFSSGTTVVKGSGAVMALSGFEKALIQPSSFLLSTFSFVNLW